MLVFAMWWAYFKVPAAISHRLALRWQIAWGYGHYVLFAAIAPLGAGLATPTEIEAALAEGLTLLKLFPAGALGGPGYIAAISPPYPGVRFIPTGGIGQDTMADYLALDAVLAVGGTWIVRASAFANGDFEGIWTRAAEAVRTAGTAPADH